MYAEGLEGLSAAVVHCDLGVVHLRGYGGFEADRLYALASSSKTLPAGIVVRLNDQGVVDYFVGDTCRSARTSGARSP